MMWIYGLLITCLVQVAAKTNISVTDFTCGKVFDMDEEREVTLKYNGTSLAPDPCEFVFTTPNWDLDMEICVDPEEFELPCSMKLIYNGGFYPVSSDPAREFSCDNSQTSKWCTSSSSLHIGFETEYRSGGSGFDRVKLKITQQSIDIDEFLDRTVTSVALVAGVLFFCVVLIISIILIIYCCVCKKLTTAASTGTVYRSPQRASATTAQATTPVYPQQARYQPQPHGYQSPPQGYPTGYQPPPHQAYGAGNQPPPQGTAPGYQPPPPPQGFGAGYQPTTAGAFTPPQPGKSPMATEKHLEASAPAAGDYPMTSMDNPPPYPGK